MALKGSLLKPASSTSEPKPRKESKLFTPGVYDLKVANIEVGAPTDKNPAWRNVKVVLTNKEETKVINHFLLMSETEISYEGMSEVRTLMLQRKITQLLAGFGLKTDDESLEESLKTVLNKSGKFKGKEVKVKIGYYGDHLVKSGEGWALQNYKGEIKYGPRSTLEEIKAELDLKNVKYSKFPEVVMVYGKK